MSMNILRISYDLKKTNDLHMKNKDIFFLPAVYRIMRPQLKARSWLIFLGILFITPVRSQLKGELNLPRIGDELVKQSVPYRAAGESGKNIVWDFSSATVVDTDYPVVYFSRKEETGLIGAEPGRLLHYRMVNDSLLMTGYESPNVLIHYSNPGVLLRFPIAYGDSLQDDFSGRGKHNDRLESIISGSLKTSADGLGSIVLPNNECMENVVRIHTQKTETSRYAPISSVFDIFSTATEPEWRDTVRFSPPATIVTEIYQWYEAGYRYPVFETVESYRVSGDNFIILQKSSFFYHPYDQVFDTGEEQALADSLQSPEREVPDPWADLVCVLAPNPAKTTVGIEMYLPQRAEIRIQVHNTQGLIYINKNLGIYPEGEHSLQLDVSALPVNNYILDIRLNEHMESLILMKR